MESTFNFKLVNPKRSRRLTIDEEQRMMFYYLCTEMCVLNIAKLFGVDRRTLYRVINKYYHPNRNPDFANRTNHPTKFDKALREAAQIQLDIGGEKK